MIRRTTAGRLNRLFLRTGMKQLRKHVSGLKEEYVTFSLRPAGCASACQFSLFIIRFGVEIPEKEKVQQFVLLLLLLLLLVCQIKWIN